MYLRIIGGIAAIVVVLGIIFLIVKNNSSAPVTNTDQTATSTTQAHVPLSARVNVSSPAVNATVEKKFTVTGEAPGTWYFEAQFPVMVRDKADNVIGSAVAAAQSDWMTESQVAFTVDITTAGYSGPASLVLLRDNPSGLPENDDSVTIPITIK